GRLRVRPDALTVDQADIFIERSFELLTRSYACVTSITRPCDMRRLESGGEALLLSRFVGTAQPVECVGQVGICRELKHKPAARPHHGSRDARFIAQLAKYAGLGILQLKGQGVRRAHAARARKDREDTLAPVECGESKHRAAGHSRPTS